MSKSTDDLCDDLIDGLGPAAMRLLGDALYAAQRDGDQQPFLKELSGRGEAASWACAVMMLGICVAFERLLVTRAEKN